MAKKLTQKQIAFCKLYMDRHEDKNRFVPAWEFVGEIMIKPLNRWVLMSYKCLTRLTDIFKENPALLDRTLVDGKSGSKYFAYRISQLASMGDIRDKKLRDVHRELRHSTILESK